MSQSLHDRIHRALGAQEIENIKTRHAYLHAKSHSFEEWDQLWVYSDDVTWAHSFGRMVGWDEMYYGSVEKYDRDMLSLYNTMVKKNPHIIGKDFLAACLGGLHSLASGVIEVAEDGKSARSFFLTPGTLCACNMPSCKRDGAMCWERYGSDFVYKDGKWWYFHEHVCPDINFTYDQGNWAHDSFSGKTGGGPPGAGGPGGKGPGGPGKEGPPKAAPGGPGAGGPPKMAAGGEGVGKTEDDPRNDDRYPHCTDPGPLHATIDKKMGITQCVQSSVSWPLPYKALDDENSYAPGHNDPDKPVTSTFYRRPRWR